MRNPFIHGCYLNYRTVRSKNTNGFLIQIAPLSDTDTFLNNCQDSLDLMKIFCLSISPNIDGFEGYAEPLLKHIT